MPTVLFDATRLLMRASRGSPTGIDRVTEAYANWLFARPDVEVIPVVSWGGYASPMSSPAVKAILRRKRAVGDGAAADWSRLSAILQAPAGQTPALRASAPNGSGSNLGWARYLPVAGRTLANWRPRAIPPGSLFMNVSHFGLEQPGLLRRLEARGMAPVVMIHDLIPILHPEYCGQSAGKWHRLRVNAVLDHASLVITNSSSTAAELEAFAVAHGRRVPPMCVAPLGLEPAFLGHEDVMPPARPYFVCVGTLEPRKNLTFLLTLWRRLSERLGEATPRLVLAGRRGWENESIIDHLDRSPPIQRFVHEAAGLDDAGLARLIGGASALLSPSFVEGFNLPIAEALAMGTPVIASDIPVHRELAADALLLDPVDGPAWLAALQAATERRARVPPRPVMGWPEHFAVVAEALEWPG